MRQLRAQHEKISHLGQQRRAHAEIGLYRRRQHRRMLLQQPAQTLQTLAAQAQRDMRLGTAGGMLALEQGMKIVGIHALG
ncbi:hypothetical protein MASR1M59_09640 [Melaminivora sp.]